MGRNSTAHYKQYNIPTGADGEGAAANRRFYDKSTWWMTRPADFYLQTVERVFQDHALPLGTFTSRGRKVEPAAIEQTALLAVEGENDDICAVGQTSAAPDLCTRLPAANKLHHLQPKAGRYRVF